MRGIVLIWQEQWFLQTEKNEYNDLKAFDQTLLKDQIVELKR